MGCESGEFLGRGGETWHNAQCTEMPGNALTSRPWPVFMPCFALLCSALRGLGFPGGEAGRRGEGLRDTELQSAVRP